MFTLHQNYPKTKLKFLQTPKYIESHFASQHKTLQHTLYSFVVEVVVGSNTHITLTNKKHFLLATFILYSVPEMLHSSNTYTRVDVYESIDHCSFIWLFKMK